MEWGWRDFLWEKELGERLSEAPGGGCVKREGPVSGLWLKWLPSQPPPPPTLPGPPPAWLWRSHGYGKTSKSPITQKLQNSKG